MEKDVSAIHDLKEIVNSISYYQELLKNNVVEESDVSKILHSQLQDILGSIQ